MERTPQQDDVSAAASQPAPGSPAAVYRALARRGAWMHANAVRYQGYAARAGDATTAAALGTLITELGKQREHYTRLAVSANREE